MRFSGTASVWLGISALLLSFLASYFPVCNGVREREATPKQRAEKASFEAI